MIEVEMNKDVREVEPKLIGPFTKRQIICICIGLCYGVPIFFLTSSIGNVSVRIIISIILMLPAISCGWVNMYGMPFEKFMLHILKNIILTPRKRKYKNTNLYELFDEEEENDNKKQVLTQKNKTRRNKKDGRIR